MELKNLKRQASHDMLTGLSNHIYAKKQIQTKIDHNPNGSYLLAILDLDQFKAANDSRGHMFGDQVLRYMAEKLRQNTHHGDIVARVGGDEFLLFLEYQTNAEELIRHIFNAVTGYYEGFPISVSMGIACMSVVGHEYGKLFQAADQALYSVKRMERGQYRFYDDSMRGILSSISPIDNTEKGVCQK